MIFIYNTKPFLNTICIPGDPSFVAKFGVQDAVAQVGTVQKYISEVTTHYDILLYMILVAFGLGFFYMVFLSYCAGVLTWGIIFIYHAVIAGLAYLFWTKSTDTTLDSDTQKQNLNLAYAFIILLGVTVLFFLFMFKRIRLAIGIIKTAALFTREVKSALFVPFIFFTLVVLLFGFWLIGFIFVYSLGTFTK